MPSQPPEPLPIIFAPRALTEIEHIAVDGLATWGNERATADNTALRNTVAGLGISPDLGRRRQDLPSRYRSFVAQAHVVVYEVEPADGVAVAVRVVCILHTSRDLSSHVAR